MRYNITLPARINLLGNPSDANEGDYAVISAAVDSRAGAIVTDANEIVLETLDNQYSLNPIQSIHILRNNLSDIFENSLKILWAPIKRMYEFSPEFREKCKTKGVKIQVWTEVPVQSGLGGSSVLILLVLAAIRSWYKLDAQVHNNYVLAELAQRVEAIDLRIACGYADRYVPLFGGLAYVDYRGKLYQKPILEEPFATYERLDAYVNTLPIAAISTGVERDSGDVHGQMRPRYLKEHSQWVNHGGKIPPMVDFMQKAWETAWKGKIALLREDWEAFGKLMSANHRVVDEMMLYCGFLDGAGWVNNHFIKVAYQEGAMGAKLTGAGGGGSVFALVDRKSKEKLVEIWGREASKLGLTNAKIFEPQLDREGLKITMEF